ncbi:MAG: hypothetical protein JXR22_12395 [Prolixibacteraceae bacterium]|nr:hypothetical protein [Prolixibacteraceae bacterium]
MGLIKPYYKIFYPSLTGLFNQQWLSCLEQLVQEYSGQVYSPVRVNIFVHSENQADYLIQHDFIHRTFLEAFGQQCPPFGVVMQAPEEPYRVLCEVAAVSNKQCKLDYGFFRERPYCTVDAGNYREYWTVGAQSVHPDLNIKASSEAAFEYLKALYDHLGISFNNIVRQWNYVGEILSSEKDDNERLRQHYQMFNETRSEYYGQFRTRNDFPAATGIGMRYLGVCIDSFAVSGNDQLGIYPISNPVQSESYHYGQQVLVGAPDTKLKQNQPPQFERAKLLVLKKAARILVSGTASIVGQETIGIGDVAEQTRVTISNIQKLTHSDNLLRFCPILPSVPDQYSYIRVYVKFEKDIPAVRSICEQAFGAVPATYVVADICRDNLLVEIETELTT